jgi:iron-sulfur cluster assembly protein
MIKITESAAKEIKSIIVDQNLSADKVKLRVGVKGGGCSGFTYVLDLIEEDASDQDELFEVNGINVMIDSRSALYLEGTEINFKDELIGRGFVFNNPSAVSKCGCGSSFSV